MFENYEIDYVIQTRQPWQSNLSTYVISQTAETLL